MQPWKSDRVIKFKNPDEAAAALSFLQRAVAASKWEPYVPAGAGFGRWSMW